jgi:hypothetical protein
VVSKHCPWQIMRFASIPSGRPFRWCCVKLAQTASCHLDRSSKAVSLSAVSSAIRRKTRPWWSYTADSGSRAYILYWSCRICLCRNGSVPDSRTIRQSSRTSAAQVPLPNLTLSRSNSFCGSTRLPGSIWTGPLCATAPDLKALGRV